ncbi:alpha/beta hydrolase fold protein [Aspergillus welwitschiae]|uniref:Alpha/beta hydrolase fold protein n=1 Tax=Aspergillus welwitschiae TaxID=1341132 RepID=A0A3F3QGZ1_9EURO|nr:alpha/beta hydrolase fold protein [Aspergillus welwitschiae]RDH38564.1 alpha/beta hydrolase fold protein [Aspergillus welwitschiae]
MSSWKQSLTFWEKVQEAWNILIVYKTLLSVSITAAFRGKDGAKQYKVHVLNAVTRKVCVTFTERQLQLQDTPTDEVYRQFMASRGLQPQTVPLNHGAKGHWIGNRNAKNVIVYYHGGGFFLFGRPHHYQLLAHILNRLNEAGHDDLAIFFLSYSLTPHAVYPVQLRQSVEALRYILTETGRSPANIFLGGDSAGGNLSLAVLLHLTHPHPEIEPLSISQPLAGVFGCAPWISYKMDGHSFLENAYKDALSKEILDRWSNQYLAGKEGDPWSEPARAPMDWWEGLKAEDFLMTAGRDEILLSPINEFVERFKKVVPNTVYVVAQDETHDSAVFAADIVGYDTQQTQAIINWLGARL